MNLKRTLSRWYPLFLISSAGLFLEMVVIRWLAAEVRLFSYFKNLSLLAAFLGLAIGFSLAGRKRDQRPAFAFLLAIFIVITLAVGRIVSPTQLPYPGSKDEFLWSSGNQTYLYDLLTFSAITVVFFLLLVFLFIPLGQATGEEMERHQPVPAYIVNLLGSLAGIWLFALLSYLQTPPAVWFGLAMLGIGFYLSTKRLLSRFAIVLFALLFLGLVLANRGTIWSPYNRLDVTELSLPHHSDGEPVKVGYNLTVQQHFHQTAMDFSDSYLSELRGDALADELVQVLDEAALSYSLPYRLGPAGADVLVVGAGMGNDVAAALRNDVSRVDAVEIDPAIQVLGRELHPELPYDDPRVNAIVDDARSFFQKSSKRYDVIAFGLLDSHTMLSSMSSVRLESFVYTLESFEQVRDHLRDDGLVAVTFHHVGAPWIEQRLGLLLEEVFGIGEIYVHQGVLGTTFVAGAVSPELAAEHRLTIWPSDHAAGDIPLATDDWPFLYLRTRKVPAAYWQVLLLVGLICLALIARSFPEALHPDWHFFFLGAAFLLIEFKAITEFALLFGTTWLVNVLAVSGVLLMALGANVLVLLRRGARLNLRMAYLLLFASLALNYLFPLDLLLRFAPAVRAAGGMILLSLPLFFSGLIFSESLRRAKEAARPLASNLTGAVAGGVLEYGALIWGIKGLHLLGAMLYGGALLAFLKGRR
jgi:hypothetical protein